MHVPPCFGCKGPLDYSAEIETRLASSRASGPVPEMAPEPSIITRLAYTISQLPRVVWYLGHGLALRQLAEAAWRNNGPKARRRPRTNAPVPDHGRLYADMAKLFLQDLANVESGIYPLPADHDGSLLTLVSRSRLFFEDLPEIHRRREVRGHRRFSIKIRAARGRATICRIFTFNRAAG